METTVLATDAKDGSDENVSFDFNFLNIISISFTTAYIANLELAIDVAISECLNKGENKNERISHEYTHCKPVDLFLEFEDFYLAVKVELLLRCYSP